MVIIIDSPNKKGRPTTAPKGKPYHIRFDDDTYSVLERYSKQEGITLAEAVRRGVRLLENLIK